MDEFERREELERTWENLFQILHILRLTLQGAEIEIDDLTLNCLLRLTDYLDQHTADLRNLYRPYLLQ